MCASWTWSSTSTRRAPISAAHALRPHANTNPRSPRVFPCAPRQVYMILDEFFLAGEVQETSKQAILHRVQELDKTE